MASIAVCLHMGTSKNLFCDEVLLSEQALDELDRHDSRRTAVAREHNYCFDWNKSQQEDTRWNFYPACVSERQSISHIPLGLNNIV